MIPYVVVSATLCAVLISISYAQEAEHKDSPYNIHIPPMMVRGEIYTGLVVSDEPAGADMVFRFGSGAGDIILPDSVTLLAGQNHALFDIRPIDSAILSGRISTGVTIIPPDGIIQDISLETYPGAGIMSRLWIAGPGAGGVSCDGPTDASTSEISDRAAAGTFDEPDPQKEIRTHMSHTTIHVFLADRYCTPVIAPQGGVAFTISTDTPDITFGAGRTHLSGVIPQGFNSAVLDVTIHGGGTIYATGVGVSPDSIRIDSEPVSAQVRLGIGPTQAMESSYTTWHVWLERDGRQWIPDGPVPVYLTTDNPVLAGFEQSIIDSTGPAIHNIRPHHTFLIQGVASGIIHTGTPAVVGDLRILAGDRDITVTAHIPGYGSATETFHVGAPGSTSSEFQVDTGRLDECIKEDSALPDGFYSAACNDMWHRLLVAGHFFDIIDTVGDPIDSEEETVEFLDRLFGGDNTDSGQALYELVDGINEYSLQDTPTAGLADELSSLLGRYLQTTGVSVRPVEDLALASQMLDRLPSEPPANQLVLDAFPGIPGTVNLVVSTTYEDGSFSFPVYVPDGTITLSSDWGISHEPEIRTYGSVYRADAPGTRPSVVVIPVQVQAGGTLSASLGGVGSDTIMIPDISPASGKRLHISTLPGSGDRDLIAILSILDRDGLLIEYTGDVYVEAGQGAADVELVEWRGGGGMIRGSVDGVGEIIIHAPGLGGGTALTTPVRHQMGLHVWHPDMVHVAEEFPLISHTVDSAGQPVRRVDVEVAGDVERYGSGVRLVAAGEVPLIIQHGGMFHAGTIEGFLNRADVQARVAGDIVELNDTVVLRVDTGAMQDPSITVHGGALLFGGGQDRWEAVADTAGDHTITVSVHKPGWHPYDASLPLRVSHLIDVSYEAMAVGGIRIPADLTLCGKTIPSGNTIRMEPGLCGVSAPYEIDVSGVTYRLDTLDVDGIILQSDATHNFDDDTTILASYTGIVLIEAHGMMPDGTSVELSWDQYAPGDTIQVYAEPISHYWGLIWDRPVRWSGLPADATQYGVVAEWTAATDESITIQYERDLTYLIIVAAAGLAIPAVFVMRHRIPGLRFK